MKEDAPLWLRLVILFTLTALGAGVGVSVNLPVPLLTGPAIATTFACLIRLPVTFPLRLRDAVFLVMGVTIGAGVSRESLAALATWPIAFAILCGALLAMMLVGQRALAATLGTGQAPALLASAPGHLSFVIALGEDARIDTRRIAIVQTIRILSLTLIVPFAARMAGIQTGIGLTPVGVDPVEMSLALTVTCILLAILLSPLLRRIGAPAPLLLAGMIVGAIARISGVAPGGLSHFISYPALALLGALIGSRFTGITFRDLGRTGLSGLTITAITAGLAAIAALLAQPFLDMPLVHVLVAFAPGGLETMAVLGAALGANPGFVAAAHVLRLIFLSAAVPFLLTRARRKDSTAHPA